MSAKDDDMDNTKEAAEAGMKDNHMMIRKKSFRIGSVNDFVISNSESLLKQDKEAYVNVVDQDEDASESLNKQNEATSESSDEQDEVDRDMFVQTDNEMFSDSRVSDSEVRDDPNSSLVINDAQSLGAGSYDDIDEDVDPDEDVEGYVPLPMSEEQVADQLSEQRDSGDYE